MLSCKELCELVVVCAKSGVAEITFDGAFVKFSSAPAEIRIEHRDIQENKEEVEKAILEEEVSASEEDIAEMMIENPSEYERLQLLGELEDVDNKRVK